MEVGKLGQVQENPSTFPQGLDLRPSPPLGAPCLFCHPLPTAMMVFPPWNSLSSQPSLGKALSAPGCLPGKGFRGSFSCLYLPTPRRQEEFFLQPLEMQRVSFWLGGSPAWASAPQQDLQACSVPPSHLALPPAQLSYSEPRTPGAGLSSMPPVCLWRPLSWLSQAAKQPHVCKHQSPHTDRHRRKHG